MGFIFNTKLDNKRTISLAKVRMFCKVLQFSIEYSTVAFINAEVLYRYCTL